VKNNIDLDSNPLPPIDFRRIDALTDETSILQHAAYATPNLDHAYCTDDASRALIAVVMAGRLHPEIWSNPQEFGLSPSWSFERLAHRYMAFLHHAFSEQSGRFRNFMSYSRVWQEEIGSEDSHARSVWALGLTSRICPDANIRLAAEEIFRKSLPALEGMQYIRPCAYGLIGAVHYLEIDPKDGFVRRMVEVLAERLFRVLIDNARSDWPWWETALTWGNAKLPHGLLVGGNALDRSDAFDAAIRSLEWLLAEQSAPDGHITIVGNDGWRRRDGHRAKFDQQPIEAKCLVQACLEAAKITGDNRWRREAERCFHWFLGKNDLGVALYDDRTGGTYDGLEPDGVNLNQGAESALAYVLSVLELHEYKARSETDSR
jgi:hypothetical protein